MGAHPSHAEAKGEVLIARVVLLVARFWLTVALLVKGCP